MKHRIGLYIHHQRENVYQHFKFTPRATRQVLLLVGIVPAAIGYAAWTQDVSVLTLRRGRKERKKIWPGPESTEWMNGVRT
jgi:hypothetical protein